MEEILEMPQSAQLLTADALWTLVHRGDKRYELVEGRLVRMSPPGTLRGTIALRFGTLFLQHVDANQLGAVGVEIGFVLRTDPDMVRGPDVAFIRRERIPPSGLPKKFWPGPPDLAVEVLSPDDRPGEVRAKVEDYLTHGVLLVIVVDPDGQTVTLHRRLAPVVALEGDDDLDASDVVPGFRCRVRDIFA